MKKIPKVHYIVWLVSERKISFSILLFSSELSASSVSSFLSSCPKQNHNPQLYHFTHTNGRPTATPSMSASINLLSHLGHGKKKESNYDFSRELCVKVYFRPKFINCFDLVLLFFLF